MVVAFADQKDDRANQKDSASTDDSSSNKTDLEDNDIFASKVNAELQPDYIESNPVVIVFRAGLPLSQALELGKSARDLITTSGSTAELKKAIASVNNGIITLSELKNIDQELATEGRKGGLNESITESLTEIIEGDIRTWDYDFSSLSEIDAETLDQQTLDARIVIDKPILHQPNITLNEESTSMDTLFTIWQEGPISLIKHLLLGDDINSIEINPSSKIDETKALLIRADITTGGHLAINSGGQLQVNGVNFTLGQNTIPIPSGGGEFGDVSFGKDVDALLWMTAADLIEINDLTFNESRISDIYMETITINLKDIKFQTGFFVDLRSRDGTIAFDTFNNPQIGAVNFTNVVHPDVSSSALSEIHFTQNEGTYKTINNAVTVRDLSRTGQVIGEPIWISNAIKIDPPPSYADTLLRTRDGEIAFDTFPSPTVGTVNFTNVVLSDVSSSALTSSDFTQQSNGHYQTTHNAVPVRSL